MTRKQIEKATWLWRDYFGLKNWNIVIFWKKKKSNYSSNEFKPIAKIETQPEYKMASLYYNPDMRRDIDSNVIVHELLHCVLSPLVQAAKENDDRKIDYFHEQVTSELERIIVRLRNTLP